MKKYLNILRICVLFILFNFPNGLHGQKHYIQATFSHGVLNSKKFNGVNINSKNISISLPNLPPIGTDKLGRNSWNGFGLLYGYQIKDKFWVGINTEYTSHQFWFNFTSSIIDKNNTFYIDNVLNINKLSIGPAFGLSWQYIDLTFRVGSSFNHQKFINGTSMSREHFQTIVLKNQPPLESSNIYFGLGIVTKIPLHTSGQLVFGGQITAHKHNQLVEKDYEISYSTSSLQLGYRYLFIKKSSNHENEF